MAKVYTTKDKAFQYGYVAKPSDLCGRMIPFRPHWWAQYQGDGTEQIFDTKKQALEWIESWKEIDSKDPSSLKIVDTVRKVYFSP